MSRATISPCFPTTTCTGSESTLYGWKAEATGEDETARSRDAWISSFHWWSRGIAWSHFFSRTIAPSLSSRRVPV